MYVVSFVAFELNHGEGWTPKYRTEYRLSAEGLEEYHRRMTTERDYRNQMSYAVRVAREEGYEEGIEKGAKNAMIEAAKAQFKARGTAIDAIAACTGLSTEEIDRP